MALNEEIQEIVEAFKNASTETFSQMTGLSVKHGKMFVRADSSPSYPCSFIVGVTGQYSGAVIMSLKEETALFLASAMLGSTAKSMDEMTESALKELVNVTVGQTLSIWGSEELLDITPPAFIHGANISMAAADLKQAHVITLITGGGPVEFIVSLEKS